MAIVTACTVEGCATLTIGPTCIDHDTQPARVWRSTTRREQSANDAARPPAGRDLVAAG
jgi:hypothetical protein